MKAGKKKIRQKKNKVINWWNEKQNKMVGLGLDISIITVNINGQNIPTKR